MKAAQLYQHLEEDFITSGMSDDWAQHMGAVGDFISENFKKRSMGLVCNFAMEINKVYTAVFPSRKVMQAVLDKGIKNAMLFVHHSSIWDIRKSSEVFQQMDKELLQQFKERRVSIYNLHVPLDSFGEYSTSVTLAKVLSIKPEKPFALYFGALCGVFGRTELATVLDLRMKFQEAVGHKVCLYDYRGNDIKDKTVAVVAGGGLDETIEEIVQNKVDILITGITAKNEHSKKSHDLAEKNRINILGEAHYSTERFACIAMVDYFKKRGLRSWFIEDTPVMEDV